MRALKVVLFIFFLILVVMGLIGLFSPGILATMGMMPKGIDAYSRVISAATLAFALATWFAFRDPAKNTAIIMAIIAWLGLEGLLILINAISGAFEWGNALPGVILDWVIAVLLVIFYPRGAKAT